MTKKLADLLIKQYQKSIREIKKIEDRNKMRRIFNILYGMETYHGVCHCATMMGYYLTDDKWVNSFNLNSCFGYWFKQPKDAKTKKETLELLQKRLDRLKTFKPKAKPVKTK